MLSHACDVFIARFPLNRRLESSELHFIRAICILVSSRAAALVAAALAALIQLHAENVERGCNVRTPTSIACHGTIIECYPKFVERTQTCLERIVAEKDSNSVIDPQHSFQLEVMPRSGLYGAAVAAACCDASQSA